MNFNQTHLVLEMINKKFKFLKPIIEESNQFKLIKKRLNQGEVFILAASSLRPFLIAYLENYFKRTFFILTDTLQEQKIYYQDLSFFLENVKFLPEREELLLERMAPSKKVVSERLEILNFLEDGKKMTVVSSLKGFLPGFTPLSYYSPRFVHFQVGKIFDHSNLINCLKNFGYERRKMVEERGDFSLRGGIIDIFPPNQSHPLRIEFFGDEIESIRQFMVANQRSFSTLNEFYLFPCREIVLRKEDVMRLEKNLDSSLFPQEDLAKLKELQYFEGSEIYLPFLYPKLDCFLDYLSPKSIFVLNEPKKIEKEEEKIVNLYQETLDYLTFEKKIPFPPQPYLFSLKDLSFSPFLRLNFLSFHEKGKKDLVEIRSDNLPPLMGKIERLERLLRELEEKKFLTLLVFEKGFFQRMKEILWDWGLNPIFSLEEGRGKDLLGRLILLEGEIKQGFICPEINLALIPQEEIFPSLTRRERISTQSISALSPPDLEPGDYVVHSRHGVAIYKGIEKIVVDGATKEYLVLEYLDGLLKVPTYQLDRVSKYIGGDNKLPKVNRLSSSEWARVKARAKKGIKKLAIDLIKLYAERECLQGHAFSPDTPWQAELEESFPYQETIDQLKTIEEVKKDMEKPKPMERLILGDVGYGKTEVAIRAAFKCVMDGKQVILLAPTTILVQQHFNTFKERLAPFPIFIEFLSRFRTQKEQAKIIEDFSQGKIDILIGTHRLLSPDLKPKDLGLLIIDEEHRFGVSQKERLKAIKKTVDVLSLSATPIPRTLQMSLSGIRDLSVIETPPEDRFPISTYVGEYDKSLVKRAILREIERGGQVYFVHNRVEDVYQVAEQVRKLVPQVKLAVAHGQMDEEELEKVMVDFLKMKYNVLVCTTIIESGIDIPTVNTLIVDEADKLGLAQGYQLRGRVGRSDKRAYAYFFYQPESVLTEAALERLKTLSDFTQLGSGAKIALKDLEIRGAGNLLGPEQHGHISLLGFELYMDLLKKAVEEIKGKLVKEEVEVKIDLPVSAFISEDYIEGSLRLEIYKKMASLRNLKDTRKLREELEDRFGEIPCETENLIKICEIKSQAREAQLSEISYRKGQLLLKGKSIPQVYQELKKKYPMFKLVYGVGSISINKKEILSFLPLFLSDIIRLLQN